MKYMLDIALIVGLFVLGYLWNGEKKIGLEQSDQIDKLKHNVAQLQLDLNKATNDLAGARTDLEGARGEIERLSKDLQETKTALEAKSAEAEKLTATLAAAVARVKELEGYKAKAIVAEMPKPIAPAAAP